MHSNLHRKSRKAQDAIQTSRMPTDRTQELSNLRSRVCYVKLKFARMLFWPSVHRRYSRQLFVALDRTEEGFCDTCKEAIHVDPSLGFKDKRELGRLLTVWNTAKVQRDTKVHIEAVHKAHGEPISVITADWTSLIRTFNIHPSRLPAQSYYEGFEERLTDGTMIAEPLSHVISLAEEKEQKGRSVSSGHPARSQFKPADASYPHCLQTWKNSERSTRS